MQSQPYVEASIASRRVRTVRTRALAACFPTCALALAVTLVLACASPALAATVFLDPGHGGRYPGAVCGGIEEQYVNLLIALETRNVLTSRGHTVKMSRTGDYTIFNGDRPTWHWDEATGTYYLYADGKTGVYSYPGASSAIAFDDLQVRCDAANASGADIFISIHNNAGGSASGTETYYNSWDTATDTILGNRLATFIQEGVVASAGTANRKVDDVGYYVIKWTNMPGALIEVAFLSNSADRARLLNANFRHKVAVGIANGVDRYFATDPYTPREPRISGADRYATSVAASTSGWPDGADAVIIASGEQWPDSLAAAPLSGVLNAPVLLTASSGLVASTAAEIARLAPERIVLLGGESALAPAVAEAAATAASIETTAVTRIAGANRYETAALIAEAVGGGGGGITVVSGEAYPDAVSASAYCAMQKTPILLTRTQSLSTHVTDFLAAHSDEVTHAVVVGGPAVVSEAAVKALQAQVGTEWLWGANRYETNRKVIERYWPSGDLDPLVATATNFPDALVAGPLGARRGQPVMLCGWKYLSAPTREWIMHNNGRIYSFTMMGGTSVLSTVLEWELDKARSGRPPVR
jgi:N-acetylmuramoyl-L-alanine amidase/putative cell wall-binding protein